MKEQQPKIQTTRTPMPKSDLYENNYGMEYERQLKSNQISETYDTPPLLQLSIGSYSKHCESKGDIIGLNNTQNSMSTKNYK